MMDEHSSGVHATPTSNAESYAWAYSVMDSSRVSTFFISILLIVYGSFRSLALEEDKEGENGCKSNQICQFSISILGQFVEIESNRRGRLSTSPPLKLHKNLPFLNSKHYNATITRIKIWNCICI